MIDPLQFYNYLNEKGLNFFTGVPDSLLKELCLCITENSPATHNIIAANEGNALAIASGYHLATSQVGVVYLQNSGLGNLVNPILSLNDEAVYKIPALLIIGWRGEPHVKDEPQHAKQGEITLKLLDTLGVKYFILEADYQTTIEDSLKYIKETSLPVALIVKKNAFSKYDAAIQKSVEKYQLTREVALKEVIDNLNESDFIVSTTGKTSREIFEIRKNNQQSHDNDFLTVGSMGHTSSIALGMSLGTKKNVYCIDGDGSFLMHMGAGAINASIAQDNFKYLIINNGAHESVGGQPTVAFKINLEEVLLALGFNKVFQAYSTADIKKYLNELKTEKLSAMVIYTRQGSRDDLGRPTLSPQENKVSFMKKIKGD